VIAGLVAGTIFSSFGGLIQGQGTGPSGMSPAVGSPTSAGTSPAELDLLHTPPLLVLRGQAAELGYELVSPRGRPLRPRGHRVPAPQRRRGGSPRCRSARAARHGRTTGPTR
jgi:hypothetical protein